MKYNKSYVVLVAVLVSIGLALAAWNHFSESDVEAFVTDHLPVDGGGLTEAVVAETIYVQVSGQVNKPGVYALKTGARVYEAVELAGGVTTSAAIQTVNQAELLVDGTHIHFPKMNTADAGDSGLININTANVDQLQSITGIGASKAKSIVKYREEHGAFQSIEDIMNVSGIKEALFTTIEDSITIY